MLKITFKRHRENDPDNDDDDGELLLNDDDGDGGGTAGGSKIKFTTAFTTAIVTRVWRGSFKKFRDWSGEPSAAA